MKKPRVVIEPVHNFRLLFSLVYIIILIIIMMILFAERLDDLSEKQVSYLSGAFCVCSTVGVGFLAYEQNKEVKKYTDAIDERNSRPEVFPIDESLVVQDMDDENWCMKNDASRLLKNHDFDIEDIPIYLSTLNYPVINFSISSYTAKGVTYKERDFEDTKPISLYSPNTHFDVSINLPCDVLPKAENDICEFDVKYRYENIFGDKYFKAISYRLAYSIEKGGQYEVIPVKNEPASLIFKNI